MSARFLAWYLSGLLGVICFLLSLITVVPNAEIGRTVAQGISGVGAMLLAIVGQSCGRLPTQHWVNRSRILRNVLLVLAVGFTVFLLVGVIG